MSAFGKSTAMLIVFSALMVAEPARAALDGRLSGATVLGIETTYVPNRVNFKIDRTFTACTTGNAWFESSNPETVKATLSVLTAAYLSGKPVYLVFDTANVSTGFNICRITFVGIGSPG